MVAHARAELPASERLRITEIFHSLQGEAASVGQPTVFIRLTGCPLRCRYCDTEYAFTGGTWRGLSEIVDEVARYGARYVCVTGGEPLAQPNTPALLTRLCDAGWRVSIETSGSFDVSALDPRVVRVVDWKTPGSGEQARNLPANLEALRPQDQLKFVLCDRADYEWANAVVAQHRLTERCEVLYSPSYHQLDPRTLAEWILADRLQVRFQIQLHKVLWGEERGR
jgi:7-carboxy-7-deazaguanine synthase